MLWNNDTMEWRYYTNDRKKINNTNWNLNFISNYEMITNIVGRFLYKNSHGTGKNSGNCAIAGSILLRGPDIFFKHTEHDR